MQRRRFPHIALATMFMAVLSLATAHAGERPRSPRLRRMVVVGDSILAGFVSGGFVRRDQRRAAPVLVARRAGERLVQPYMSLHGVPPPLRILDRNGNHRLDPGEVRRGGRGVGFRSAPERVVRNLAVPGEDMTSVFERVQLDDLVEDLLTGDADGRDALKFLILGLPPEDASVSQLTRARDLRPSFLMVWLGNNEVLGMATRTRPDVVGLSPAEFGVLYGRFLRRLAETGADMAVANLPDVTRIAALRGPGREVGECRAGAGVRVPVGADALLSITLDPATLPVPDCSHVLDAAEQTEVRATVRAFNAEIAAAIDAVEASHGVRIAHVDMFALFDAVAARGFDVHGDGRLVLTTDYLGGIFSLDGIHPSRTGHALIANAFIQAINVRFGESIAPVNVARVAARDPLVANRYRPAGEPPFGLVADVEDDVEDILGASLRRVGGALGELVEAVLDLLGIGGLF